MEVKKIKKSKAQKHNRYERFADIDGQHDLQKLGDEFSVNYEARARAGGKVAFFNFGLAREIGLIPDDHDTRLSKRLEQEILNTFAIMIINEYDKEHGKRFRRDRMKENKYMATRYLQLQHKDKVGVSSGDGRSVWNGTLVHKNKRWDISSCGTGATRLSPATTKYNRFFESGDPTISYGCGYSETDEGLTTAIFSDVLHRNGIATERVLAVIEFEPNICITVRAYDNLLRPSHFYLQLKQNNLETLRELLDYYIDRQAKNRRWPDVPKERKARYQYFLENVIDTFARVVARFEDDYIFCWLDWDGDNVLMDGGIIDYGSIRQFGLFHHEYRFDDEKYSTNIKEQKSKARHMMQIFIQLIDYASKGKRRPLQHFAEHKLLSRFDQTFEYCKDRNLLHKIGLKSQTVNAILQNDRQLVQKFRKVFSHFERAKSARGRHKVSDGITWDAIFCMRDLLRQLPQLYTLKMEPIGDREFIDILKSDFAKKSDLKITEHRHRQIKTYQILYTKILQRAANIQNVDLQKLLLEVTLRSSVINKYDRITGDSITCIVDKIQAARPKYSAEEIYHVLQEFGEYQSLSPDRKISKRPLSQREKKLLKKFLQIAREYREGL